MIDCIRSKYIRFDGDVTQTSVSSIVDQFTTDDNSAPILSKNNYRKTSFTFTPVDRNVFVGHNWVQKCHNADRVKAKFHAEL